jgi:hypothetical protein
MILADIQSDIVLVLGFFGGLLVLAVVIAFLVARHAFRCLRRECKEAGGRKQFAKTIAKNVAIKVAAITLKSVIKRRFS